LPLQLLALTFRAQDFFVAEDELLERVFAFLTDVAIERHIFSVGDRER
jgi:hypothetical protein